MAVRRSDTFGLQNWRGRGSALPLLHLSVAVALFAGIALAGCGTEAPSDSVVVNVRGITEAVDSNPTAGLPGESVIQFRGLPDVTVDPTIPDQPRQFCLGVVSIGAAGPGLTSQELDGFIKTASQIAECIVVRPLVDWDSFRPGGTKAPERLQDLITIIDRARSYGMPYSLVELDPLLNRHSVSPLPPALEGQNFSSPDVRTALRRMALEVAAQVRPTYLSFGVEINGYYEANPTDFGNLVSLHKELYEEVKAVSPETKVTVAFNLEALQGLLRDVDQYSADSPRWFLIDMFEPKVDAIALSTLPWPVFPGPANIPDDYISRIGQHTQRPILLSEIGWTTSADVSSSEAKQLDYVARMARLVTRTPQVELVAWSIMSDPPPGTVFDAYPSFLHLGLFRQDGTPKPAEALWSELFRRPFVPLTP